MSRRDGYYRRGGFYRIDERTGFRVRADQTQKEWDGTIVDRNDFETRHPQDFVRGRRDNMAVPDPRPEPTDIFQFPAGGPFFLLVDGAEYGPVIEIGTDQTIVVYRGTTEIQPSDL